MNPRLRLWLIGALGVIVAVVVSFGIAQEVYVLAAVIVALVAYLALEWIGGARPEGWLLAAAILGYVLANRGFAQLSLSPRLPLLPAEVALVGGVAATLLRMARRETSAMLRDPLNYAVIVWMALGAARLWPDMRSFGAMAVRDFATVYYALFFFIAQGLARHAASVRTLRRGLLAAFTVLPVSYFLFVRFPEFFLGTLRIRGVPLVFYKDDLVAAYFFAGFFLLMTADNWPRLWRGVAAAAGYAMAFTISSSRAAIMGLIVTSGWWALARRWSPWKLQALLAPLALAGLTLLTLVRDQDFHQSRVYSLYEHVASMVDFTGTGRYSSEDRRTVGDNNRFRLAWWRSVTDEVREGGPVFGLGFGYDLTERFIRTYERDLGEDFNTRSPHSIVFSVLGRMGVVGLLALVAIVATMAAATLRLVWRARTDDAALAPLGWWSVAWVMFTSGCFGVVLEGPMGAVIFWTALGLANATTTDLLAKKEAADGRAEERGSAFAEASADKEGTASREAGAEPALPSGGRSA